MSKPNMAQTTKKDRKRNRGFSLIEVLMALLVFAVGILTVAGLQIVSKKTSFDAVQRTTATLVAHDIVQRMRANSAAVWGNYLVDNVGGNTLSSTTCVGTGVTCSATQMAAYDLDEWEKAIDGTSEGGTGGLVDPKACVRGPAGGGEGTYYIIIAWRGVSELSNPTIDAGTGANVCGSGNYGTDDVFRRVLMITTYLSE